MRILRGRKTVAVGLVALYALFWFWYGGNGEPLPRAEVEALMAGIEEGARSRGGGDRELLESLRRVGEADDGREFFMVNLIRHRKKALYPDGYDFDEDVEAAERRYASAILPRLVKRASFPFFVATPTGLFLQPDGAEVWDQVAFVRYRSRRDFLEMVAEPGMAELGVHKWASVEKTHVFPVTPLVTLLWVRTAVAVGLVLLWGLFRGRLRP
jgi:hypothetical protein